MKIKASKTSMTVASLVVLAAAGFYMSQKKDNSNTLFSESESLFKNNGEMNFKDAPSSSGTAKTMPLASSSNSPAKENKAMPSSVAYIPNDKSISRKVAIAQASRGNWYESIVSEVEGFRSQLYNDNTGFAIGNGWNVSLQSESTNQRITQGIGLEPQDAMQLASMSNMKRPSALPKVSITPDQATKAAQLIKDQFEQPMRALVPSFNSLKPNERAALVYHAYKVGPGGAKKYTGMLSALKTYSTNPTEETRKKVADSFTYTYKMNGKVYTDNRSKLFLAALFTSEDAYSYLLGTTPAPKNFSSIAKLASQKIDTSKPADDQINDDFGKAKEQLLKQGKPLDMEQRFTPSNAGNNKSGYFF